MAELTQKPVSRRRASSPVRGKGPVTYLLRTLVIVYLFLLVAWPVKLANSCCVIGR